MRVIFSLVPGYGHLIPMIPLARACRSAGHQVGVLTTSALAHLIESEGLDLLAAGPRWEDCLAAVRERWSSDVFADARQRRARLFADVRVDLAAKESLSLAKAWRPDLLVCELTDYVGPLVAAALEVPYAIFPFGVRQPDDITAEREQVAKSHYVARGLSPKPALRYIDPCPPSLNFPGWRPSVVQQLIRPEPYRRPGQTTTGLPEKGARPRILVSFGTVFGSPRKLSLMVRMLTTMDVEIVVPMPPGSCRGDFNIDVGNVSLVPFTPLDDLLADADVVLAHGGAGTVLASLARGVPLVMIPQGADQPTQAERVTAVGAGLTLINEEATPRAVVAAVQRCLTEPRIRSAAGRMRDEITGMPAPEEVADILQKLLMPGP